MKVVTHDGSLVQVEVEGKIIQLTRCVDRYTAHANGFGRGGNEVVQIWEDRDGLVIRVSRPVTPGADWTAQQWV
jgi:hypothetical protein